MNRRDVLAASGVLATASLGGCLTDVRESAGSDDRETDVELPQGSSSASDSQLARLVEGNAAFGMGLYRHLIEENDDNRFLSPYSISAALAMTYAGARGETRTEMTETLEFTLEEDVHPAFASLRSELADREDADGNYQEEDVEGFRLDTANALWGEETYEFSAEFLALLEEHYGAGLHEASFETQPDRERQRINDWVAERTEDRIEELIPAGDITPGTRLVLTNAIYFLAGWDDEFHPDDTEPGTFTTLDGTESTVPLMDTHLESTYADLPGLQAVELPYVGTEVSMVLLLPEAGEFEAVERSLDGPSLLGVFEELSSGQGSVVLPRFEFRTGVKLREHLAELGMPSAFGGGDFSGMQAPGEGDLAIDNVIHKTFVSVDEEGTEAAGATAVTMWESGGERDGPPDWGELRFDRPFLFCIRDRPTDAVLFFGRVTDAGEAALEDA